MEPIHPSRAEPARSDYDPNSLTVEQARQLIQQFLEPLTGGVSVDLADALYRTVAVEILSPGDVPPHDYSAMDGYAVHLADVAHGPARLKIAGSAYAGHPYDDRVEPGTCVRIMTGALIPPGCDSVIKQEEVTVEDGVAILVGGRRHPENIRRRGEDMRRGSPVLARGQLIRPVQMGLLASLGLTEVQVYRKLKVVIFSTGDELRPPGTALAAGQIYDSNRYTLLGMLHELGGVEIQDRGNIRDDPEHIRRALTEAAVQADVIITSGGVSVGEADYVRQVLEEIGQVAFWKIAMKPGRPLACGKIGACHFFGLPGNPVAVMVTFQQFVSDALRIIMGRLAQPSLTMQATCGSAIRKMSGRTEFQRGILSRNGAGWSVCATGDQGSGILSSMSLANCFIVLPLAQGNVEVGAMVEVQPFAGAFKSF
ncbi:MAG: gephyrin-like molybdotransferase Glp [Pseudomonadota bacterium]